MIQELKVNQTERVETGAVRFTYANGREDWSGYFMRGDNYAAMRMYLRLLENSLPEELDKEVRFYLNVLKGYLVDDEVIQKAIEK